jgi:hypothetical protein
MRLSKPWGCRSKTLTPTPEAPLRFSPSRRRLPTWTRVLILLLLALNVALAADGLRWGTLMFTVLLGAILLVDLWRGVGQRREECRR